MKSPRDQEHERQLPNRDTTSARRSRGVPPPLPGASLWQVGEIAGGRALPAVARPNSNA